MLAAFATIRWEQVVMNLPVTSLPAAEAARSPAALQVLRPHSLVCGQFLLAAVVASRTALTLLQHTRRRKDSNGWLVSKGPIHIAR
jgi:hypothetical protein